MPPKFERLSVPLVGAGAGIHVTEGAEHNLVVAAGIVLDHSRVSRTIKCATIILTPPDLFDHHKNQMMMENEWVNKYMAESFKPLNESNLKEGWKVLYEVFVERAKSVHGVVTKAPLAYLLRARIIPLAEGDNDANEYADLDHELIARHTIILDAHRTGTVETLEKSGPRKKMPHINTDNAAIFNHVKTTFEHTPWWTHARPAVHWKDGRCDVILMATNLQSSNAMDEMNVKNKADALLLRYEGEGKNWGLVKYINAHKKHHHVQSGRHDDHGFNDFEDREKVVMLINGIKTGEYDQAVIAINADVSGARQNFEKAQLKLLEYKSLMDERKHNTTRNLSSLHSERRGRGGGGYGGGGCGYCSGHGQGRGVL